MGRDEREQLRGDETGYTREGVRAFLWEKRKLALYRMRHGGLDADVGALRGERLVHCRAKLRGEELCCGMLGCMGCDKPSGVELRDVQLPELEMLELGRESG